MEQEASCLFRSVSCHCPPAVLSFQSGPACCLFHTWKLPACIYSGLPPLKKKMNTPGRISMAHRSFIASRCLEGFISMAINYLSVHQFRWQFPDILFFFFLTRVICCFDVRYMQRICPISISTYIFNRSPHQLQHIQRFCWKYRFLCVQLCEKQYWERALRKKNTWSDLPSETWVHLEDLEYYPRAKALRKLD